MTSVPALPLRPSQLLALVLSGGAYLALAYATPRTEFGQILALFALATVAYAWLLHTRLPLRWGLVAALLFRLLWLPATPALSDDFYRFRWDGLLSSTGQNVFAYTPRQLLAQHDSVRSVPSSPQIPSTLVPELRQLFSHLNSPDYFSVYPPVCQLVYQAAATAFPRSETGFLLVVRGVLLLADIGAALLLLQLLPVAGWPRERALLYLLHPLVIVELVGNVHAEGLVVFFLLLAGSCLARKRIAWAGSALALAIATKLLPLLVLPLLLKRLRWRRFALLIGALVGSLTLLFWLYDFGAQLLNISQSLRLYYHRFEFNASVFYLLRAAGQAFTGADQIAFLGPALATAAGGFILWLAYREQQPILRCLPQTLLLALTGYLALATTVHPWYLVPLVALSCFTPWRFALVWAALAGLTYATYRTVPYAESLGLVALEYGLVLAWAVWEYKTLHKQTGANQHASGPHQ